MLSVPLAPRAIRRRTMHDARSRARVRDILGLRVLKLLGSALFGAGEPANRAVRSWELRM